jgi:hypothetical protein
MESGRVLRALGSQEPAYHAYHAYHSHISSPQEGFPRPPMATYHAYHAYHSHISSPQEGYSGHPWRLTTHTTHITHIFPRPRTVFPATQGDLKRFIAHRALFF